MLPSPREVILLRQAEESDGDLQDVGARVRLAGEIGSRGALCDVYSLIGQARWRGQLLVSDFRHVRVVSVDSGSVIGVRTNCPSERLGQVMFRFGVFTQDELKRVVAATKAGVRFGEAAARVGGLAEDAVFEMIEQQIREVVYATIAVGRGSFFLLDGVLDEDMATSHAIGVEALLTEAVTRMDEVAYFRERIPSDLCVPFRASETAPKEAEAVQVFRRVNGERTVRELGRLTGLGEFATTRLLYSMVRSGNVGIRLPAEPGGVRAVVGKANEALAQIFQVAADAGKQEQLRSSIQGFAKTPGPIGVLLQGVKPRVNGTLDAQPLLGNLEKLAPPAERERVLKELLSELVSFALFSTGLSARQEREEPLKRSISQTLKVLKGGR